MKYDILINQHNPCPNINERYLVKYNSRFSADIYCEKTTLENWQKLKNKAKEDGFEIDIASSYRSKEEQIRTWNEYLEQYGEDYTHRYVAIPGYSEHQSGLAIDIYLIENEENFFENELINKPIESYIAKTAPQFGFIIRYPKGKEEITGYNYEPWHIRYVGEKLAKEITEKNITLEEYYEKYK